jgi:hypothetical protein
VLSQLINRECVLLRRSAGATDELGNDIQSDDAVDTVVELQQRQSDEHDNTVSDTDWIAFFLPDEDVRSGDAVVVDGFKYEVVGDPWEARNPRTQAASHIEAGLRRTAGSEDAS